MGKLFETELRQRTHICWWESQYYNQYY